MPEVAESRLQEQKGCGKAWGRLVSEKGSSFIQKLTDEMFSLRRTKKDNLRRAGEREECRKKKGDPMGSS